MDQFLLHPIRVAFAVTAVLFAFAAYALLGSAVAMMAAVVIELMMIVSGRKWLRLTGALMLAGQVVLMSVNTNRTRIDGFEFEQVVRWGCPVMMLLMLLHLAMAKPGAKHDRV